MVITDVGENDYLLIGVVHEDEKGRNYLPVLEYGTSNPGSIGEILDEIWSPEQVKEAVERGYERLGITPSEALYDSLEKCKSGRRRLKLQ